MKNIRGKIGKFLFMGICLSIAVFVYARVPYDRSSPPGRPSAYNIEATSCEITFRAPIDDGGAPIQYYIIEGCKYQENQWVRKGTTQSLFYRVTDGKEGTMMRFRVIAVNAAGKSDPSDESDYITFKHPFSKLSKEVK